MSHRAHGTGTIDITDNMATGNSDIGIAIHDTCQGVEELAVTIVGLFVMIRIILVRTTTAAVDIATVRIVSTVVCSGF